MTAAGLLTVPAAASRAPRLVTAEIPTAHLYGDAGDMSVHTIVSVPSPGGQTYQVAVSDDETGEPVTDLQRVFLTFIPPSEAGLAEERVQLDSTDLPGLYETAGAYTPVVGEWSVEVTLRRAGSSDESVDFDLLVDTPPPPEQLPPADTGIGTPPVLGTLWRFIPPSPYEWLPALTLLGLAGRARSNATSQPAAAWPEGDRVLARATPRRGAAIRDPHRRGDAGDVVTGFWSTSCRRYAAVLAARGI